MADTLDPWAPAQPDQGPPPVPNPDDAILSEDGVKTFVTGMYPGARVTSGYRTAAENARIGGAEGSMHTWGSGEAADIVLPPDVSPARFRANLTQLGLPVTEFLVEKAGDPHSTGYHVHWGWGPKNGKPVPATDPNDPWAAQGGDPWAPAQTVDKNDPWAPAPPPKAANSAGEDKGYLNAIETGLAHGYREMVQSAEFAALGALRRVETGGVVAGTVVLPPVAGAAQADAGVKAALRGDLLKPAEAPQSVADQAPTWGDVIHPSNWKVLGEKVTEQFAESVPALIAGAASGPTGAGLAAAAQSLGPYYQQEMQRTPNDPDGAYQRAIKAAAINGTFTSVGWKIFEYGPFKKAIGNILFQAFVAQPAVSTTQKVVENVEAGEKPLTGTLEQYPGAVVGTLVPLVGMSAFHLRGREAPPETEKPGEPKEPMPATTAIKDLGGPKPPEAMETPTPKPPKVPSPEDQAKIDDLTKGIDPVNVLHARADVDEWRSAAPRGYSLFQAIKDMGGIRTVDKNGETSPEGQEVLALLKDVKRPGLINNKTGIEPDTLRDLLDQKGWFGVSDESGNLGPGAEMAALYERLDHEAHGTKIYHPETNTPAEMVRRAQLEHEMHDAEALSADHPDLAAAKLAAFRAKHAELASAQMDALRDRATRLDVPYDHEMSYADLLANVIEREAVHEEAQAPTLDEEERQIDDHLAQKHPDGFIEATGQGLSTAQVPSPSRPPRETRGQSRAGGAREPRGSGAGTAGGGGGALEAAPQSPELTPPGVLAEQALKPPVGAFEVGRNADGRLIFEDDRGVRFYVDNGIRITEPVQITPTRGGPALSVDRVGNPEFNVAEVVPKSHQLAERIHVMLEASGKPITTKDLQQAAAEVYAGTLAGGEIPRDEMLDAAELAVNRYIARHADEFSPAVDKDQAIERANLLAALKNRLPTQTVRAGEKEALQQFSTPPDYSYAAAWAANLGPEDVVLEPSAGTGSLIVHALTAKVKETHANDLSDRRAEMLRSLNPTEVTQEDAEHINAILPPDVKPTVVLMNPPFSNAAARGIVKDTSIGAKHLEEALGRLEPNGRLVAIVGGGMKPEAPTFRNFWNRLLTQYTLRANLGVSGDIYRKYGTTFPTRLLVIDKTPTPHRMGGMVVRDVKTAAEIIEALSNVRDNRPLLDPLERPAGEPPRTAVAGAGEGAARPNAPIRPATGLLGPGEGRPGEGERGGAARAPGAGERPPSSAQELGAGTEPGVPLAHVEPERPDGARAGNHPGEEPAISEEPAGGSSVGAGDGVRPDGSGERAEPGVTEAPAIVQLTEASLTTNVHDAPLTDAVYEVYKPRRVRIEGAKEHPGALVQSAAMASVEPPLPEHTLRIPRSVIDKGQLSDAQLEAVVYAGHAHGQMLEAEGGEPARRRGFFIGDGTGVGKGREIGGIILDNWSAGRTKHIWVSEGKPLIVDAKRDWSGIGRDAKDLFDHGSVKAGDAITKQKGILFTTYDTLKSAEQIGKGVGKARGQTRVQQIVNWVGKDFDGVLAFDEAHNLGNSFDTKGNRGVKKAAAKALAGVELQKQLPNARVVYVSATGATEIGNLAYADRLGLWGRGTAFANRDDFISKVGQGGIAAMELASRDMKAMGHYIARSLSYDGVEYDRVEHQLTPQQIEVYDKLAEGWQLVLRHFQAAMETSGITNANGGSKNAQAKSAILSQFWGGHQRFFNQTITSMQMPTVLRRVERDITEGRQAVLQLVSTNEAAQERALLKKKANGDDEEYEDLDMSPRDQLLQLVHNAYPTQRFEDYNDENGNLRSRPVKDAHGNPVHDPQLIAARERLLTELASIRVPDGPLEMLLNHFGTEKVAEVTGRKQRIVRAPDPKTGQTRAILEKRGGQANVAEADAFQSARKPILVFSEAGGTGRSYHADIDSESAGLRRSHYLIQAGWRADKAVQGFGRTHRTNQASAPIFHLVTTDLQGQRRFISSIARRLAQLGALTKGERRTGDQGLFGLRDNLESDEAKIALHSFYDAVVGGKVEGFGLSDLEDQMGLKLMDPATGRQLQERPPMTQFLNRLLSLKTDLQNKVFNDFSARLDGVIDRAAAAGTLDTGVETFKADKIVKKADQVVYTDKKSGAQTRHVQLETSHQTHPASFEDTLLKLKRANKGGETFFVRSLKSGKIFGVADVTSYTNDRGNIIDQKKLIGPTDYQFVDAHNLDNMRYWEPIADPTAAKQAWDQAVAKIPPFSTSDLHLITGAVLPIWDRLAGSPKIFRLQTDAGERMLGRVIPSDSVDATLAALGADRAKLDITPKNLMERVIDNGEQATLANGWKIKRSMVASEPRLELIGPDYNYLKQLQADGVIVERIDWKTRFFLPTGAASEEAIERVTRDRPVMSVGTPTVSDVRFQRAYHGSAYDFDKFRDEKIGTGEGAQAFGYGHYFAGEKAVAEHYRDATKHKGADVPLAASEIGLDVPRNSELSGDIYYMAQRGDEPETAAKRLQWKHADIRGWDTAKLAALVAKVREQTSGKVYQVDLRPKDNEWLDWDKPFSAQSPHVQDALKKLKTNVGDLARGGDLNDKTGREIYRYLTVDHAPPEVRDWTHAYTGFEGQPAASAALREAGVPGIRYKDQISRGAEGGTHNFVVFDPEHIDIEAKFQRGAEPIKPGAEVSHTPDQAKEVKLAQGLAGQIAEGLHKREDVIAHVQSVLNRIVPGAEVRAMARLRATGEVGEAGDVYGAAYRKVSEDGVRHIIAWSMEANRPERVARHEAVHSLRQMGAFKESEWNALVGEAARSDWLTRYDIAKDYADLPKANQYEEAIAERFADWRKDRMAYLPKPVRDLFMKVDLILKQVAAGVRRILGKDATAEDVFALMESGTIGNRALPEGADPWGPADPAYARKQQEEPTTLPAVQPRSYINRVLGEGVDSVGHKLALAADRYSPDMLKNMVEAVQKGVAPMSVGHDEFRATAKDFANAKRANRWEWQRVLEWTKKNFTPSERKLMFDAASQENTLIEKEGSVPEGLGLGRLEEGQRKVVDEFQRRANDAFTRAKALKMTTADPKPSYVPHTVIQMSEEGAKPLRRGGGREGSNLTTTTGNLRFRKYMTPEETEAAARNRFGEEATVVHDILTLPLATMKLEDAIAGRTLINKLKEMGKDLGEEVVVEGTNPDPASYFTIDHPAFRTWDVKMLRNEDGSLHIGDDGKPTIVKDQLGKPVFEAKPLYIDKRFEGPLRAVLQGRGGDIYNALANLKGKSMSLVMWTPAMHNAVIWGKAIPAAPWKVVSFQAYFDGAKVLKDPALMREAILTGGVDPIGHRFFQQDISAIMETENAAPGRSLTARLLGYVPGLLDPRAGDAVKRAVDNLGDVWHNKLLWELVGKLQMGLWKTIRDKEIANGTDPQTAARIAGHFANRYAGVLPMESMSRIARQTANLALFSRSFTLTNLAAGKDLVAGLPRDQQAQILRDKGLEALNRAQGTTRRKALGMLAMDIGLSHIGLFMAAYAAYAVAQMMGSKRPFQPPSENEPGHENRFLIGYDKDGTAIYGRLPTGKVGEEYSTWLDLFGFPGQQIALAERKFSLYTSFLYAVASNQKDPFGHKLYDPYADTPKAAMQNMGRLIWKVMDSVAPLDYLGSVYDLATGQGDPTRAALGATLPIIGITTSKGAPGGPAQGQIYHAKDEYEFRVEEAMPSIREQISSGDVQGASERMRQLGIPPSYARWIIKTTKNPSARMSAKELREFNFYATPEEKARVQKLRGTSAAPPPP